MNSIYLQLVESVKLDCPDMCNKCEFCEKLKWIIDRAKYYSKKQNKPWKDVLDEWEKERTYWYYNFYNIYNQPDIEEVIHYEKAI